MPKVEKLVEIAKSLNLKEFKTPDFTYNANIRIWFARHFKGGKFAISYRYIYALYILTYPEDKTRYLDFIIHMKLILPKHTKRMYMFIDIDEPKEFYAKFFNKLSRKIESDKERKTKYFKVPISIQEIDNE